MSCWLFALPSLCMDNSKLKSWQIPSDSAFDYLHEILYIHRSLLNWHLPSCLFRKGHSQPYKEWKHLPTWNHSKRGSKLHCNIDTSINHCTISMLYHKWMELHVAWSPIFWGCCVVANLFGIMPIGTWFWPMSPKSYDKNLSPKVHCCVGKSWCFYGKRNLKPLLGGFNSQEFRVNLILPSTMSMQA